MRMNHNQNSSSCSFSSLPVRSIHSVESGLDIDVVNSLVPPHDTWSGGACAAMQAAQVRYSLPADPYRTATTYRTTTWLRRHAYAYADAEADADADADTDADADAERVVVSSYSVNQ